MTPLLWLLLTRPSSGIWRIERFDLVQQDLVAAFGRSTLVVDNLAMEDKAQLMDQLASAFQLPDWFGRNWDALNDSLAERASGSRWPDVVVIRPAASDDNRAAQNLATLAEIAEEVASESNRWFLIVGPEPTSIPSLPTG